MDIASILLMSAVLMALAYIGFKIFARFGMPGLIGEIIVGILIANIAIGDWSLLDALGLGQSNDQNSEVMLLFAELGVIFLLFSVGLETKVGELMSVGRAAMTVAVVGVVLPFIAGFVLIQIYDGNMHHALFMGAAMVATSVGITARVIKDMRLMDTKESKIIIGAAVIDDILGMMVLAIVVGMTESGTMEISNVLLISVEAILFVMGAFAASIWLVPRIGEFFRERRKDPVRCEEPSSGVNMLIVAVILCLGMSWFADQIGLAAIIGAFLGGMLLADYAGEWNLSEKFNSITTLFISFFFLNVGMEVNLGDLTDVSVIAMATIVIVLAILTKYFGCSFGAMIGDRGMCRDSRRIIGFGMIPRGEVGIIVASIGLASGAMSSELYAVVVIMAVVTTIMAPPLLAKAFRKKYPLECEIPDRT